MSEPVDPSGAASSDVTLLRRLRDGEGDAATELYLRYARRLHGLARRQTSSELARRVEPDEIVQSVFRTFFRRVHTGDYTVPAGQELWGLLLVIALNKVRQAAIFHRAARRDIRRTASMEDLGADHFLASDDGGGETALTVLRMVVDEVIAALPEAKREMVRLRIDGHDVEDIAIRTKRSKRTVERTLQDFRATLSRSLEESTEPGMEHRDAD
ncbi:MAG: sigma-70 family RNA polymerase sigma factor [Planctomycetota bacterium]|nr:sigma-70 family RNA polymerase sigma factor [Planctomycetota bacterium]